jgi:hypothetical protein
MVKTMLTTMDNPFSPFDEFGAWYAYDVSSGYHTCSFLARIVNHSNDLSEADEDLAVEQAIDEIIRENVSGIYKKVSKNVEE